MWKQNKPVIDENSRNVEEIVIPPEKRNIKYWMTIVTNELIQLCQSLWEKQWIKVHDLSSGQYSVNKNVRFNTSIVGSDLCDYSNAYIVVKATIVLQGTTDASKRNEKLALKNNALFESCIPRINNTLIDSAEDLDIVITMYNLLEYSENYSMTSRSLLKYYRDEVLLSFDDANENNDGSNYMIDNNQTTTSKSFEYMAKVIGSMRQTIIIR